MINKEITIIKELKKVSFSWFPETKTLLISQTPIGTVLNQVVLSKTEMFSLTRFIIRVSQKMSSRTRTRKKK